MPAEPRQDLGARGTLDFVLNCIEGGRFKDAMGQTAEWYVGYSLGCASHLYHVESYAELAMENHRLREALGAMLDWAEKPEGDARLRRTEALDVARAALGLPTTFPVIPDEGQGNQDG